MRICGTYTTFTLIVVILALITLSACGQKGDLYLPDETQASLTAPDFKS